MIKITVVLLSVVILSSVQFVNFVYADGHEKDTSANESDQNDEPANKRTDKVGNERRVITEELDVRREARMNQKPGCTSVLGTGGPLDIGLILTASIFPLLAIRHKILK